MIIGKKALAVLAGAAICCTAAVICADGCAQTTARNDLPTVVIDAGHGGIDAGVRGAATGVKESEINLAVARELRGRFANAGFDCVMTRTTSAGLYGDTSKGFKMRDMQKRRQIIEDCDADMVISVHQNTCPLPSRRGGHVFFDGASACSRELAADIQRRLNDLCGEDNESLTGDYYMLKCTAAPSVIVECGFLSNAEDEKNLCDPDFRKRLAEAIFMGAISYLS